jgi:ferritin-like metal-binding protein YciE
MSNPRDLFLQLLGELLWIERTLAFEVLPKLQEKAQAERLVALLREHLEQTKEHAARVEQVFRAVGAEPSSNLCEPVEKLAEHHDELAGQIKHDGLADVFHATAATTTEHYELSMYDALLALGSSLELGEARSLLEQNRRDEEDALKKLEDELQKLVGTLSERA